MKVSQIQKGIVSAETIFGNTAIVCKSEIIWKMLKLESRGLYLPEMTAVAVKKVNPFILIARQKSEWCIAFAEGVHICMPNNWEPRSGLENDLISI